MNSIHIIYQLYPKIHVSSLVMSFIMIIISLSRFNRAWELIGMRHCADIITANLSFYAREGP